MFAKYSISTIWPWLRGWAPYFLLKYDANEPAWHWLRLKTEWAWLWMEWYATYNNQSENPFCNLSASYKMVTLSHYGYCVDEVIWCQLWVFTILKIKYKGHHIQYWPWASPYIVLINTQSLLQYHAKELPIYILLRRRARLSIRNTKWQHPMVRLSTSFVSRATEKHENNRTYLNAFIMVPAMHFKTPFSTSLKPGV